jgi:phosphomannomutase / phosphoglucomutase
VSIYKPCDIRGSAGGELTPELYRRWGVTLGRQVEPGAKFVVGGDVRESTPRFFAALVDGLCDAGLDVVALGALPTPMIYYAKRRLAAAGCAIVTASHNAADVNGLKWMIGDRPPTEKDVRALKRGAEGAGPEKNGRTRTSPRGVDVTFDYVAWLQEAWIDAPAVKRPIILDGMHGVWACRARRYLQAIFPHSVFSAIHDVPDGSFGGRAPNCARHEALVELGETVYQQRAVLGIAFDGDGDRVAFVDDEGTPLTAEESTWILLQSFAGDLRGEPYVYDVKFSDRVPEAARKLGAEPLVERSGHTFIRNRMLETGAPFGAEISGHFFFRDLAGGDDGLFAACRMINFLAGSGKTLSQMRRKSPKVFVTPDLRVRVKARYRPTVVRRVRETWSKYPQTEVDGVRICFPDGWALVRNSVTEPALTFRFESRNWNGLTKLVSKFCDSLPEVGEALWASYEDAIGVVYEED